MTVDVTDQAVATAERIEERGHIDPSSVLDVKYTVGNSGVVTEVWAVLNVGGPTVKVECLSGIVFVGWAGETDRTHVDHDCTIEYGRRMQSRMERRID